MPARGIQGDGWIALAPDFPMNDPSAEETKSDDGIWEMVGWSFAAFV